MGIGKEFKTIGKDIIHGVEYPFEHLSQIIAVLDVTITDAPELKKEIAAFVAEAATVIAQCTIVVEEKGLVLTQDLAAISIAVAVLTMLEGNRQVKSGQLSLPTITEQSVYAKTTKTAGESTENWRDIK